MFESREGQRVPEAQFRVHTDDGRWRTLTTRDLFDRKNVVVFSLPGAFTPTCSSAHVPRYNELYDEFKAKGIDAILCIAVNDTFVMNAWKKEQRAERITFVPDGNGSFTQAMGLLVPKDDLGFGRRAWRYSMLVRDGVIEKMFIEPDEPNDPLKVSDADTMLSYLGGKAPHDIVLFTKPGCPHCARAKSMLAERHLPYEELPASPRILKALPGQRTTPQVFADGRHLGGADELATWLSSL